MITILWGLSIALGCLTATYIGLLVRYRAYWNTADIFLTSGTCDCQGVLITVVIPARNEEANIGRLLSSLEHQTLSAANFEVIVVDDFSEDGTASIVEQLHPFVKLIRLRDHVSHPLNSYKKKAIETAIAHAKGELIVCTDADCVPHKDWLHIIAIAYTERKPMFIAMPVLIQSAENQNSFISLFQGVDFLSLQGITGAAVKARRLNMCNGANLAYQKAAFDAVGGFSSVDEIASGDDMLLMHKISEAYPNDILYLKDARVIMRTEPVATLRDFFKQRIRWASKSGKYNDKRIMPVLLTVYMLNLLLLLFPVLLLVGNSETHFQFWLTPFVTSWLLCLLLKTTAELYFLFPVAKFFGVRHWLWYFPLLQPFHILYTIIAGFLGKFSKYEWKGRKVK